MDLLSEGVLLFSGSFGLVCFSTGNRSDISKNEYKEQNSNPRLMNRYCSPPKGLQPFSGGACPASDWGLDLWALLVCEMWGFAILWKLRWTGWPQKTFKNHTSPWLFATLCRWSSYLEMIHSSHPRQKVHASSRPAEPKAAERQTDASTLKSFQNSTAPWPYGFWWHSLKQCLNKWSSLVSACSPKKSNLLAHDLAFIETWAINKCNRWRKTEDWQQLKHNCCFSIPLTS